MKFLIIGLMAIVYGTTQAEAKPCNIYVENVTLGAGSGWYTTKEEARSYYKKAIEKMGHEQVSSKEEADYIYDNYAIGSIANAGIFGLPGDGERKEIYFELSNKYEEVVTRDRFFSCHLTYNDIQENITCGPLTLYNFPKKGAKKLSKMLKEISCD